MNFILKDLQQLPQYTRLSVSARILVHSVLSYIDNPMSEDDILDSIDVALIYNEEKWIILHEYCDPTEANWSKAYQEFEELIFSIVSMLEKEVK